MLNQRSRREHEVRFCPIVIGVLICHVFLRGDCG
jgi:hypothetical protein